MHRKSLLHPLVSAASVVCALLACCPYILATPYATCLTNSAGTVSFRLNETNASVKVIGNAGTLTNDLGVLPRNLTVTNLTASGMTGGVFRVEVSAAGTGVPVQISDNTTTANKFESPRSVAVNKRPASPYFGRIYVGNVRIGTTAGAPTRTVSDGIYLLNADSTDAVGQGDTARTAGIEMVSEPISSIYSFMPWRLRVGDDDDMLYICNFCDAETNKVTLYQADANVSANSGTNVLQFEAGALTGAVAPGLDPTYNHGSISEVIVRGKLANGTLTVYTTDEDYETNPGFFAELNSLWRYDIGSGPFPWSNAPIAKLATPSIGFVGQTMGLDRGTNGYFYLLDNRSAGTVNVLQVIDPTGPTELYRSIDASAALGSSFDLLSNSVSVAVSPDMKFCAVMRGNGIVVLMRLVNGIPNLAGRIEFSTGTTSGTRQIVFDAADNLYTVSNTSERMRIYSLGLTTTATTTSDPTGSGGEGGAFSLATPATTVSVTVDTTAVYEAGPVTAVFTVVRTNDTLAKPLTVLFNISGTATRGTDYLLQTNGVTFTADSIVMPAGVGTNTITLIAQNDTTAELTETATLNLIGSTVYSAEAPTSASVDIVDNELPAADVTVVQGSMYERVTNDYVRLRIVRRGDINAASFTVNLTYAGTAAPARYTAPTTVTVDPGVVNQNFDITPLNDSLLQGDQTIICNVAAGAGYSVGTNNPSATATIVDDEVLPETVLWSENFNVDSSATWATNFGSGNGIDDYRLNFSYDYASGATIPPIPPAPHSTGDTLGMYLTVNKDEPSTFGAAGINVYPNGHSFSNNFAVRFDMYLMVGTASSTTEYALFGINHGGTKTNWFRNSGPIPGAPVFDGLWYGIEADGAALGDYVIYSAPTTAGNNPTALTPGVNASTLTGIFKSPPWQGTSGAGAPANVETSTTPTWSDVDIAHFNGVVTLKINHSIIMQYTNQTAFTNGNIMLGYCDAYDSIMSGNSCVIYDNLRVVAIGPSILSHPTNLVVAGGSGSSASFSVVASTLTGVTNYQWYRNGTAVTGATSATLNLSNLAGTNYGTYNVIVSDGAYSLTSSNATLTPPAGPSIITQPSSVVVVAGKSASFSVVGRAFTGTTNYQWMRGSPLTNVSGANYSGITGNTLNVASVQSTNVGPYAVRISDGFNSLNVTSVVVNLSIAKQPTITNSLSGSTLNLIFPTEVGPNYVVEWKGELTNGAWNQLVTNVGTGSPLTVPESTLVAAQRFYRIRMQ